MQRGPARTEPTTPYILVVDDFVDGREMVEEYLTFRGFSVVTASDGSEAIALATSRPPAIILLDLTMPVVDGWEAARRLKRDARTRECIVIALTAHALKPDEAKAREAGCDGFIAKPFDLAVLADALADVIANGRAALDRLSIGQPSQSASSRPPAIVS